MFRFPNLVPGRKKSLDRRKPGGPSPHPGLSESRLEVQIGQSQGFKVRKATL